MLKALFIIVTWRGLEVSSMGCVDSTEYSTCGKGTKTTSFGKCLVNFFFPFFLVIENRTFFSTVPL